jgi:hypothetical protein
VGRRGGYSLHPLGGLGELRRGRMIRVADWTRGTEAKQAFWANEAKEWVDVLRGWI